jgi:hypothetical protein
VLLALLLAAAAPQVPGVPLFSDPRLAEALGRFDAHPGAWVEYAVLPRKGPQARLRIAVLSAPGPDGRYWLEVQSQQPKALPVAMKMLFHGAPGRIENLERLYVFIEGLAPTELPLEDARAEVKPAEAKPKEGPPPKVAHRGTEELKLQVGAFRCEVLQVAGARIFRSERVPLWGLVREVDKDQRIELVGFGQAGAETVFPPEFDQGKGSESTK